jgi:hypothetical protein
MSTRIRNVEDENDMQKVIDDFITTGYVVKEQGLNSTLMQKHSWGSAIGWIMALILGVIVGLFTVGIGFIVIVLAYAVVAHVTAPKLLLRIKDRQGSVNPIVVD